MICDARELFLKQHRFDLIFKYLKDVLRRLQYALQYNIYRKERRSDGVRSVYVFGVKLFSYRKRQKTL